MFPALYLVFEQKKKAPPGPRIVGDRRTDPCTGVQFARYVLRMRGRCEHSGAAFDEPGTDEERRTAAARFYRVDPSELDEEDVETLGCQDCGYSGWLVQADEAAAS